MGYLLSIDGKNRFIRYDLSGSLSEIEIADALADLKRVKDEKKLDCVLCDETDLTLPPDDVLGFRAAQMLSTPPFQGLKLAIVRPDTTKERLFEIAANNRGGIVAVFDSEPEAVAWLHAQ